MNKSNLDKKDTETISESIKEVNIKETSNKEVKKLIEELGWEKGVDIPEWGCTEVYIKTISKGYLMEDETPKDAYWRVSTTVARRLGKPKMASKFFDYIWQGWLCLATPVLSNTGTERGLPISCFGIDIADSILDIGQKNLEMMLLAKHGGGVGIGINQIRPAGSSITGNGTSDGVIPFVKMYDSTILATNQGAVRRGAASVNMNIEHDDFYDWLEIREPKGDVNRQCLNMHQCVVISNKFMRKVESGNEDARKRWGAVLKKRRQTGEPYIMFKGNVNNQNPEAYKKNNLKVFMTNICSEITLATDESHSFVCCLSSLNLAKFDEWKDTDLIYTATIFLDGVLEEFIQKAKNMRGFENSVRSAEKGRALGLGVLGWHSYLQNKGLPFEGLLAQYETRKIFSQMKLESERASRALADEYGEPLWCIGTGMRNTHLRAVAPTVSNSKNAGNLSAGIEPWPANVWTDQSAKGTFIRKNPSLEKYLKKMKLNTKEIWDKMLYDGGSVQDISDFDDWGFIDGKLKNITTIEENTIVNEIVAFKEVFKTFKEINQLDLITQAGIRQQYIDQSVSLNLAFPKEASPKWLNQVHLEAWKLGVKTLYYMRTESVLRGDIAQAAMVDCIACDG